MSFSHALFHCISIAAIIYAAVHIVVTIERRPRMNRRHVISHRPDALCDRSPHWSEREAWRR